LLFALASLLSGIHIREPQRRRKRARVSIPFLIVTAGTGGELCVSRAMKVVGEVHDFRPAALVRFVLRAMGVGWMWIGIAMMTLAFFSLLAMLSIENVSFVVP